MLFDDGSADEMKAVRSQALRRGRILTEEELEVQVGEDEVGEGEGEEAAADEGEGEGEGGDEDSAAANTTTARREVKWGLIPDGLQPAPKPAKLDSSLIGMFIYLRWATPHSWLLGKIEKKFDQSTPRLFRKFNFRIKWFDGWENHMLLLDNYNHGPTAPYKSWVLLEKSTLTEGGDEES